MKPFSKVIQLIKHSQDGFSLDAITFIALCEDGSIWFYYPSMAAGEKWEKLSEMEGEKYIC